MAAPFYSQADQDIYASGNKFIPQEQYRLGPYTPPEIMGQNTEAGITATGAANPYKWPWPIPTGDGGAGDVSGTQVTYKRPLGLSPGALGGKLPGFGNWAKRTLGDVQNLYSKLPTPGNILKWGIDKYQSSKAEKEEEEARLTTVTRQRAINKLKAKYQKDPDFIPPTTGGGADIITTTGGTTGDGGQGTGSPGGGAQAAGDLAGGSALDSPFAQGGRIGYERGRVVNPGGYQGEEEVDSVKHFIMLEQIEKLEKMIASGLDSDGALQDQVDTLKATPTTGLGTSAVGGEFWEGQAQGGRIGYRNGEFVDENINVEGPGFDVNENLMASDDVNTRILENLFDKYIDLGFSAEDAEKMAMQEFEQMSMGPDQDQGIASLV